MLCLLLGKKDITFNAFRSSVVSDWRSLALRNTLTAPLILTDISPLPVSKHLPLCQCVGSDGNTRRILALPICVRHSGNLFDESLRRLRSPLRTNDTLAARSSRTFFLAIHHVAISPMFVQMTPRA